MQMPFTEKLSEYERLPPLDDIQWLWGHRDSAAREHNSQMFKQMAWMWRNGKKFTLEILESYARIFKKTLFTQGHHDKFSIGCLKPSKIALNLYKNLDKLFSKFRKGRTKLSHNSRIAREVNDRAYKRRLMLTRDALVKGLSWSGVMRELGISKSTVARHSKALKSIFGADWLEKKRAEKASKRARLGGITPTVQPETDSPNPPVTNTNTISSGSPRRKKGLNADDYVIVPYLAHPITRQEKAEMDARLKKWHKECKIVCRMNTLKSNLAYKIQSKTLTPGWARMFIDSMNKLRSSQSAV